VAQTLQLEYSCTKAEMQEAQTLSLRKQIGGGSKWRTWIVLFLMLIGVLAALYFQIRNAASDPYGPYVLGGAFLFATVFVLWKNTRRKGPPLTNKVELSEQAISVVMGETKISSPWSAVSDLIESPNLFVLVDRTKSSLTVLPKRAFPNENWQTWFRALVANRPRAIEESRSQSRALPTSPEQIRLTFQLGLRDYLDRALATSWVWLAIFGIAVFVLGTCLYQDVHPSPRAVYTGVQVYFMFMLPFTFVMAGMIISIATIHPWLSHKKHLIPCEVALSTDSITSANSDGFSVLPWTNYKRYKETRRCFIMWNPQNRLWVLLPRRAFVSPGEWERCRELLARHLRKSRWFFG
jgi:YcxB-like protein